MLASAHFFDKHRALVPVSRNYTGERAKSFEDVVFDKAMLQKVKSNSARWAAMSSTGAYKRSDSLSLKRRALGDLYGKANQFPPYVAAQLLKKASAIHVLDPFAGWGDRLVAAAAAPGVFSYTGIDANEELKAPYAELKRMLPDNFVTNMSFGVPAESVDYSELKYDTVLSCPPYYLREQYKHMPKYANYDDFMDRALVHTFEQVYHNLANGGTMMVVLPEAMGIDLFKRLKLTPTVNSSGRAGAKTHVPAAGKYTTDGKTHTEKVFVVSKPRKQNG